MVNALKTLWTDEFSVVEHQEIVKPNGANGLEEVTTIENKPCKLSFSSLSQTNQNEDVAAIVQVTKLFCSNELDISAGSKIIVKRQNRIFEFKQSGQSGVFSSHQEIVLVPFKEWA